MLFTWLRYKEKLQLFKTLFGHPIPRWINVDLVLYRYRWSLDGLMSAKPLLWRHGHGSVAAHGSCTVARGEDVLFPLGRGGHSFGGHGRPAHTRTFHPTSTRTVPLSYIVYCVCLVGMTLSTCSLPVHTLRVSRSKLNFGKCLQVWAFNTSLCAQFLVVMSTVSSTVKFKLHWNVKD